MLCFFLTFVSYNRNMQRFGSRSQTAVAVMAGLTGIGLAFFTSRSGSKLLRRFLSSSKRPTWDMTVRVARNESQCVALVNDLKRDIDICKVLGFDCEWVKVENVRHPVALLQLASHEGRCGLFQIHLYSSVPTPLQELLEDTTIMKVGVDPFHDAKYLSNDYGINVTGTYDIRHLVDKEVAGSLASIVYTELDVKLPKNVAVRVSNWEAEELSEEQQVYAANDALASLLAFNKLIDKKVKVPFFSTKEDQWKKIHDHCAPLIDIRYVEKTKNVQHALPPSQNPILPLERDQSGQPKATNPTLLGKRSYTSIPYRKTPLYDNAFMLAPDGSTLCTCDFKKAEWYVSKGLATVVETEPMKIQLNFQPKVNRSLNGPSAEYYTIAKENRCVVCGREDSYVRKKIVPHEYRKHFPECMKNHQCHDILLLCAHCHVRSNISDHSLRVELSRQCNAPLASEENVKVTEDKTNKSIRSAARALLNKSNKLPEKRRKELINMLSDIFQTEITSDLLESLKDIDISITNQSYAPHGLTVVEHFAKGGIRGLMNLEKMWREHFLKVMEPKYLPPLWSVNHYHEHEKEFYFDSEFLEKIKFISESKRIPVERQH
ncbi:Exonuclease 3'-5' domain-containing protein 2 [Frankliniella fusca]|uniref:Exonuclease 3'-5' domain-containing protein 2 n=1 Tax=Frankliniella fusca TaxID=407009 RepID=A0AAE1I0H8_9NEOP|nr:Exonuclease 3'-5' domain-containing protein 2 [Frankliniella fusca]